MTELEKVIDPKTITFLEATTRDEALKSLVNLLAQNKHLKNPEKFLEAILIREELVSTGIGMGIAFPHAKLPEFNKFFVAIGIQKEEGLEWNSLDGTLVKLIFLIGGPNNRQNDYLHLLSKLTQVLKEEECRKKLLKAKDPETVAQQILSRV